MPRAPTTTDVFNAIAEERRRDIIDALAGGPRVVGDLVEALRLPQPAVSKHLAVLREVGIVAVSRRGRERVYQLNAEQLKPVHEWIKTFERFWTHQIGRIKERAERKAVERRLPEGTQDKESHRDDEHR
jgi:DNA-binding transcriptional ArsR family regulator